MFLALRSSLFNFVSIFLRLTRLNLKFLLLWKVIPSIDADFSLKVKHQDRKTSLSKGITVHLKSLLEGGGKLRSNAQCNKIHLAVFSLSVFLFVSLSHSNSLHTSLEGAQTLPLIC